MSAEDCINTYFYDEKKPAVDAVINLLSFSLIMAGESLIKTIMEKKAIPEGKWTPVDDIINRGGSVYGMPVEEPE